MKPEISIIVPVYNAEKYIHKCMDSLIGQTYKDIEIICMNGGSTDCSLEILKEYEKNDSRVYVIDKKNEGVSLSRNEGLKKANGKYVMFVDADDWTDLATCEQAVAVAEEEQADIVMWSYVREFETQSLPKKIFEEEKIIFQEQEVRSQLHRRFIGLVGSELAHPERADALCTVWGKLYKRELIQENAIQFIDIREIGAYEDGMFNLETFYFAKKVVYIDQCFYHYLKTNSASITSRYKEKLDEQWEKLFGIMHSYIEEKNLPKEYQKALNNRVSLSILGQGLNIIYGDLSVGKKIKKIKKIISSKRYRDAYKELEMQYFPMHWKAFYGCAKYNNAVGVYALLLCIRKVIGN